MNNNEQNVNAIYLERKFVHSNGKDYANYFVRGTFIVRGTPCLIRHTYPYHF